MILLRLLAAPVTAPLAGFKFVLGTLEQMAERELYDLDRIRDDYLLLQLKLEEGEITEEEYLERESEIMARLREAREYHQSSGGG